MKEERKDTLIIGAGAAGIAAAAKLYENGITDIIVIEAENRIGGRIHTVFTPEGDLLEMGAAYIHKRPPNCVLDLAQSHGKCTASSVTFDNMIYARSSGELVKKDMSDMMRRAFRGLLHKDFAISKKVTLSSLSHYVSKNFPEELKKVEYDHIPHEVKEEFVENAQHFLRSYHTCDLLHEYEQMPEVESSSQCTQPGTFALWKDTGFKTLFDLLLKNCTEHFVEEFCCLDTEVVHVSKTANEELKVRCSNGVTYVVAHVICTIPLGVLQNSYDSLFENFLLPEEKIRAIRGITVGTIDKIHLRFSDIWWPEQDCNGFALLWTKQDRQEFRDKGLEWATGIFAITRVGTSPHVLIAWLSGEGASMMETVADEEVHETILSLLRRFLEAHFTIADSVKCYRTKWFMNKHFGGSYGFRNLQKDVEKDWSDQMARPIYNENGIPILLFAGEASDPEFYSTVHGAVESGWREADRIISLKDSSPEQL